MVAKRKQDSIFWAREYCYFVQRANSDIRIGYSYKFPDRYNKLCAKYGEINVLGLTPGGEDFESELHDLFAEHRIYVPTQRHANVLVPTDWFRHHPSITEWVAANCKPYDLVHPLSKERRAAAYRPSQSA